MNLTQLATALLPKPAHVVPGQKWGIPRYQDRKVVGYVQITVKAVDEYDGITFEERPDHDEEYAFSTDVLLSKVDGFVFLG